MTDIESTGPAVPAQPTASPAEQSVAVPAQPTASPAEQAEPPVPAGPRRASRVSKAVAAVLVAALAGVGIGEVIIRVHYADDAAPPVAAAAAPSPSASTPVPWGAKSNGNHFGNLRDLLLPVPTGYRLGPDYKQFGNDSEFGGNGDLEQAKELLLSGVPAKYLDQRKKALDSLHFTGAGVRSLTQGDNRMVAVLQLAQFNQQAVSQEGELYGALIDDTDLFRRGPQVPDHPDARCALPMLDPGDQLDYLSCYSAEGDLLVQMRVFGVVPLDQNKVVDLFRQQLDRLARPGASV
ncbi:hypothetical protein GCM10009759_42550 [Kitasatospora saccharophila]|uniref:Secreted protein n=1 Tax=Kitasatospora saccharophila TaxID=407973 RepID=A0ABN2X683_9ACTN